MVEALYIIKCENLQFNGYTEFDLHSMKKKVRILQVMLSILAAWIGGINFSFNKGFTICFFNDGGLLLISTYVYLFTASSMAITQLVIINEAMSIFKSV